MPLQRRVRNIRRRLARAKGRCSIAERLALLVDLKDDRGFNALELEQAAERLGLHPGEAVRIVDVVYSAEQNTLAN